MARSFEADILASLELLDGLHDDGSSKEMPGAIEYSPQEIANHFSMELREASDEGKIMAGPYVGSFYGRDALRGITMPNYLANASTDHVNKFLEWHGKNRTALHEHLAVQHAFLTKRHQFVGLLQRLASEGYVTAFTNSQGDNVHMETMNRTILHIGNLGDTYLDGIEGYFDGAAKALVVAPGVGDEMHERVINTQDRIDRILPRALGGIYGRGAADWLRSAFGEHLHQVLENGDPMVYSPLVRHERERDHPFAFYQRQLVAELLTHGDDNLTKQFMLAMTSKDTNSNEWFAFRDAFDKMWDVQDGFDKMTEYMQGKIDHAIEQYPDSVRATHRELAAKETLAMLHENPRRVFDRPERAKPAVGALAISGGSGGKHRPKPGRHRVGRS